MMKAKFDDIELYFSVHKRKNRANEYTYVYIVSNIDLCPKIYLEIYKQRWDIEKMFRTMKQLLGLSHCASRDLDRQKMHIYLIFFSYSFLESEKSAYSMKNPENVAKHLEKLKYDCAMSRITSFSENFQCFA